MRRLHRFALAIVAALTPCGAPFAISQGIDLNQLNAIVQQASNELAVQINLAGRQRMLTQKMSKEAVLVAMGVAPQEMKKKLLNTALLFNRTLQGLIAGDKEQHLAPTHDKAILRQLDRVLQLWKRFLPLILDVAKGKANRATIEKIAKANLPLLAEMDKAVKMYEQASGANTAELALVINLAGRQRMLTQKMCKEYLLAAYGIEPERNLAEMKRTMTLFDRTLKGLMDGDAEQGLPGTKDPAIRAQLRKVMDLWARYRPMLLKPAKENDLKKLEEMSLAILKEMNRAVKMYEESW